MTKPLLEVKAIRLLSIIAVIVVTVVSLLLLNEHHKQLTVTVLANTTPPNHGHLKFTADHYSKNWPTQKGATSKIPDSLKEEITMRRDLSLLNNNEQDDQLTVTTVEYNKHNNQLRIASAQSKTHSDRLTATFPSNHGLHFVTYHHSITLTSQKEVTPKINDRVKEEMYVLKKNLQHPLVTNMHIITANKTLLEKASRKEVVGDHKVSIYDNGRPPTMKEVFQYVSDHLVNKIVVVSNGDIYLGSGFDRLNHSIMTEQRIMYTLTRRHAPESNCTEEDSEALCSLQYKGSHDTFIFILKEPIPSDVLDELDYQLGCLGSENRLMWAFETKFDYCLLNPCCVLETYHFHCSGVRTSDYQERINTNGKSVMCSPSQELTHCRNWLCFQIFRLLKLC
jgi:hypothetical protein